MFSLTIWESSVQDYKTHYEAILLNFRPMLLRRRRLIFATVVVAAASAFLFYSAVGERYEAYALLRVGQGIKERAQTNGTNPFDGVDLSARIDSVARIGLTDHVIRQAAIQVGYDQFVQHKRPTLLGRLRQYLMLTVHAAPAGIGLGQWFVDNLFATRFAGVNSWPDAETINTLRSQISAKQEGRSDLLRISFRNADPDLAAAFANELASGLVANYADLVQVPGADTFFQQQTNRLEQEVEKAADALRAFSVSASIYAVGDQRTLLLKRANDLAAQLASTRGTIQEKAGQKQAIMEQLLILRPVYQSKSVTGIVKGLGGQDYNAQEPSALAGRESGYLSDSPPLLLVHAYQDNIASLMKVSADLNGSRKLEAIIANQIEQVNAELATLSSKEAEYDRLKRVLSRASAAAENYGTRTIEEQINSDIAKKAQLSSVRVVQTAEAPSAPVFPEIPQLVMLALIGGLLSGVALAIALDVAGARAPVRHGQDGYGQVVVGRMGKRGGDHLLHAAE